MVWRFSEAPEALRSLHTSSVPPEWIASVPRSLHDSDVEDAMHSGSVPVHRYDTADALVYVGLASANSNPNEK